jgi:NAD(P)-dependent dehydrogenase (short-subunit alcohol dehydrogenase family)/acyl carrier protein
MTREQIQERVLELVSERTGYPAEMLGLDADLEGDLGIDSIKRVEIAGTFTQSLDEAVRESIDIEELTASKTLTAVIDTLAAALGANGGGAPPGEPAVLEGQRPFERGPAEEERIGRLVVQATRAPAITTTAGLCSAGVVAIVDDEGGVGEALAEALASRGEQVVRLPRDAQPTDAEQAAELAAGWRERGGVKALVHLPALGEQPPEYGGLPTLHALAQALQPDLEAAASAGGAALLGATRLGGAFGVGGDAPAGSASRGAIHGFLKTAAHEWPAVRVKSVDLSDEPPASTAELLLAELDAADGLVEVGYRDGERTRLAVVDTPLAASSPDGERAGELALDADGVVLVTGGARGITARAALLLAERHRPTLVLVGRTSDEPEGADTAELGELSELREAMIEARKREQRPLTPALVERDCRRILQAREVRENLRLIRQTGARAEYVMCDVSDEQAFGALIDSIYEEHGRIDGVLHGAGIIEDKLIRDKQADSLQRVMATKAGAARTLAQHLRPEDLRFLVFFSSVSGRFGNSGQSDYAAASEVLGKLAHELDARWPGRVVSIDWGPWRSAGMVSEWLEQEFARRGVALIGLDQGCRMLYEEVSHGHKGEAEVVVGAATGLAGDEPENESLPLLAGASDAPKRYTLDLARDLYLDDHRIDGRPVLPFAVAMELMAQAAVAASPGRPVAGLREIRLFDGVTLDGDRPRSVDIEATPSEGGEEFVVTLSPPEGGRPHYRSTVRLGTPGAVSRERQPRPAPMVDARPFPMPVADAYRELLFHGPLFQGIEAIDVMDERGASALLRPSEAGRCVAGADGLRWLLDPVLLDSALQVQVLWARLQWEVTLLPAEIGSYTWFGELPEDEPVRHELRIRADAKPPLCNTDHWFYAPDGRLIATMQGVVGVGAQALNRLAGAKR